MWDRHILRTGVIKAAFAAALALVVVVAPAAHQPAEAASRNEQNSGFALGAAFMDTLNKMTKPAQPRRKAAAKRTPDTASGPAQIVKPQVVPLVNVADTDIDPFAEPAAQSTAVADKK